MSLPYKNHAAGGETYTGVTQTLADLSDSVSFTAHVL